MSDLAQIPTETLRRMRDRVRRLMVVMAALDAVAVTVLALLLLSPTRQRLVPFLAPILLLPTIAVVPVVMRLGAIRAELRRRK